MRGWPDGDRLDKAGQPGGSVSAVYSPAAAMRHTDHAHERQARAASDCTAGLRRGRCIGGTAAS